MSGPAPARSGGLRIIAPLLALSDATAALLLAAAPAGADPAPGAAPSADNLALVLGNATGGVSLDRAVSVNNFNPSGTVTLGGTNTSGTNTFTGNLGLGRDTTVSAAAGGTVQSSCVIVEVGSAA